MSGAYGFPPENETHTIMRVPITHSEKETITQSTANVAIVQHPKRGASLMLMTSIPFDLAKLRKLTGLQRPGEIAEWLQRQVGALQEMLYDEDSEAHRVIDGYLESYAEFEREDEASATANPCGGCHHSRAAARLARGHNR